MNKRNLIAMMVCLPLMASNTYARSKVDELDERVTRIEQMVQNLTDMLSQMEQLQGDVQKMRGELDESKYQLDKITKLQKDLYREQGSAATIPAPSVTPSPMPVPGEALSSNVPPSSGMITIADERGSYSQAQSFLQKRQYADARKAFEKILVDFPNGEMTANSYYWLGEINLIEGDLNKAKTWFSKVLDNYPEHPKVSDSLYKLGNIAYNQGDLKTAKQMYIEVLRLFPTTSAAKLAKSKLDTI